MKTFLALLMALVVCRSLASAQEQSSATERSPLLLASHVRIVQRNHNPSDPEALWYPISAREQGTIVDSEAILGMLEKFNLTEQDFRDAINSHYKLKAKPLPKIAKS